MYPRRRLLGHPPDLFRRPRPTGRVRLPDLSQEIQDHTPFFGIVLWIEVRHTAHSLELGSPMYEQCGVTPVVQNQVRGAPVGPTESLIRAPPVLLQGFPLPSEDWDARWIRRGAVAPNNDSGGGVVLRREDVAGGPAHLSAQMRQGLDKEPQSERSCVGNL